MEAHAWRPGVRFRPDADIERDVDSSRLGGVHSRFTLGDLLVHLIHRRGFSTGGLALAVATAAPAEASPQIATLEQVLLPGQTPDAQPISLQARMEQLKVPGVSVAISDANGLLGSKAWGVLQNGARGPATPETLFQAASISKAVTAFATMRLVEAGRLQMDEDVNLRLQAWKIPQTPLTAEQKVTVRRLLSHTAGLSTPSFDGLPRGRRLPSTIDVLNGGRGSGNAPVRVTRVPGQAFEYSGGGFMVLQLLLEETEQQSFEEIMQRLVLRPIGMTSSTFQSDPPAALQLRTATAHDRNGRPLEGRWLVYPQQAAAGLWSTAPDLALFGREIVRAHAGRSSILSKSAAELMSMAPVTGSRYGLGLDYLGAAAGGRQFGHSGSNEGYKAFFMNTTAPDLTVAVLTNGNGGSALMFDLAGALGRLYANLT